MTKPQIDERSDRVEARNVSLYPVDWSIIDDYGAPLGLNTSAALRVIVRKWQTHTEAQRPGAPLNFQTMAAEA